MPARKLKDYLDKEHVRYVSIHHSPSYTASEIAASAHVSGNMVAKTVMVKVDGELAMAVVPSPCRIDIDHIKDLTGASTVEIAAEGEFEDLFPGCEVGAMPPFGNLYGVDVYASPELAKCREIAFNAGTHTELMQLAYEDFERLVHPKVLAITSS